MSGLKSTKGKPSANPTRCTAVEAGDDSDSSSVSNLSGSNNDKGKSKLNDSDGEDSDVEDDDDDFGMTRMTDGEA